MHSCFRCEKRERNFEVSREEKETHVSKKSGKLTVKKIHRGGTGLEKKLSAGPRLKERKRR